MKQIEQPGEALAKLARAIKGQSPANENDSRELMFKQEPHAEPTRLREDNDV